MLDHAGFGGDVHHPNIRRQKRFSVVSFKYITLNIVSLLREVIKKTN